MPLLPLHEFFYNPEQQVMERIKEAIQVCIEAEDRDNILPLKFVGVQQLEVKV